MTVREMILAIDDYANKTPKEIADILGIDIYNIRAIISRYKLPYKKSIVDQRGKNKVVYELDNIEIQNRIKNVLSGKKMKIRQLCATVHLEHSIIDKFTYSIKELAEDDNGFLYLLN